MALVSKGPRRQDEHLKSWGAGEVYAQPPLCPQPHLSTPAPERDRDGPRTKWGLGLYQDQNTEQGQYPNNSKAFHLLRPTLCQV